ncbi:class I SAM-dependent methyltransferase [Desmospora profundinema]|uniref:Ubiquinone/menaquinone biosynthesis C-methylase UbiE n=1 Tax=Desmospora profundinema TaxID=1571184 RepID=A0ABU1IK18_9BACL|nr:methyltransferase domain-containing protein [Desmospora profundinema]MDR6225120.1 ubiquinone/menaquinone biosynthesis C-methylase UbiE [Desmospora profundinema]
MEKVYDTIGGNYDTTRRADPEITRRLRSHLQLPNGSSVIDIACGTGNYTIALHHLHLQMTGVDISKTMIEQARTKSDQIDWIHSDAVSLPVSESRYDGAIIVLSIHHIADRRQVFHEIYRVLNQGRLVIFTSSPEQMKGYWLNEYFPQAMDAACSQMPSVPLIYRELQHAGFSIIGTESFLVQPDLKDFFLYSGRYQPELYLDKQVRKGISTFATLADPEEVNSGCERLKADLQSGRFKEVQNRYRSDQGDYCFIVAEKRK